MRALAAAAQQTALANRGIRHRIGPGRVSMHTTQQAMLKRSRYKAAKFCGGKQEIARRCGQRLGLGPVAYFDSGASRERV